MTATITFRADDELVRRLDKLADSTDRSKSWHVVQALKAYLDVQA